MVSVAHCFRNQLDGNLDASEAIAQLAELVEGVPFADGFFHGQAGVDWIPAEV